jgi:hypothetical protein
VTAARAGRPDTGPRRAALLRLCFLAGPMLSMIGIALLATLYASRAAATGSPLTALHDCALVLVMAAAVGAVAVACQHGRVRR